MPHQTFLSLVFWHLLVLSLNLSLTNNSTSTLLAGIVIPYPQSQLWSYHINFYPTSVGSCSHLLLNTSCSLPASSSKFVYCGVLSRLHIWDFLLALSSLHSSYAMMLVHLIPSFNKSTASTDLHNIFTSKYLSTTINSFRQPVCKKILFFLPNLCSSDHQYHYIQQFLYNLQSNQ